LNKKIIYDIAACIFLIILSVMIVYQIYERDVPGGSDWSTHLSKIRFIVDNLPNFPRWYPEGGFGTWFLCYYPPFSYYFVSLITWIFKLSLFEGCKYYFALLLAVGAISTYALAGEFGLGRIGRFSSSFLLISSYNIYAWWWIGQLPNMTAFFFTPLALLAFLKAIERRTFFRIMLAGASFVPIILSHLLNTFIFAILMIVTSIVLVILRPELLFIPRGIGRPPKYTFQLPKVLFLSALEAFALSAWWWLPFLFDANLMKYLSMMAGYGVISAGRGAVATALKIDSLLKPSLYFAGIWHFFLTAASFAFFIRNRRKYRAITILPYVWFIVGIFGGISPYLGIPMGLPFRFGPYMTLAGAILGGITIEACERFYREFSRQRLIGVLTIIPLLVCSFYLSMSQVKDDFKTMNVVPPRVLQPLSKMIKVGERLGTGSVGWVNVFSSIPTTYGAGTWINEFAYKFWYFTYYNFSSERIPFFAKNFNVRFFLEPPKKCPYLIRVTDGLYEVKNFSSSLVESTDDKILVLFVGEELEYNEYFFLSISATNSLNLLLVYGGKFIEEINPDILAHFNVVYVSGMFYKNKETFMYVLRRYVESGGGLILNVNEPTELPEPFPTDRTVSGSPIFRLSANGKNELIRGIDLNRLSVKLNSTRPAIFYTLNLRNGTVILLKNNGFPLIVYRKYGAGKMILTGLNLPYVAILHGNTQEAELLVRMIRYVSFSSSTGRTIVNFNLGVDSIIVDVKGATKNTGIWVKMSYSPFWKATILKDGIKVKTARILKAGPDMMLIFPEINGNYKLILKYEKSLARQTGEYLAMVGIIMIFVSLIIGRYHVTEGWKRTEHKGSGYKYIKGRKSKQMKSHQHHN